MPRLNGIRLYLPLKPHKGWHNPPQPGPLLFHNTNPCPRLLRRVIYENIAELLAGYSGVVVKDFVDPREEDRYEDLRDAARRKLKFTTADWEELYAECGGGIQLDAPVQQGLEDPIADNDGEDVHEVAGDDQTFFPPECFCEEPCYLVYQQREGKRRY